MAELARRYGEVPVPLGAVVQVISRADMERIVVALRKGGGYGRPREEPAAAMWWPALRNL